MVNHHPEVSRYFPFTTPDFIHGALLGGFSVTNLQGSSRYRFQIVFFYPDLVKIFFYSLQLDEGSFFISSVRYSRNYKLSGKYFNSLIDEYFLLLFELDQKRSLFLTNLFGLNAKNKQRVLCICT